MRGLAELRSEGRASPNLIHAEDMYSELVEVRARAYDCSHILAVNYTLFVYVHVPLGNVNARMRLYEYLGTPVKIAGQMMVLTPRERMLAVSDDQMRSREVSEDYLQGCDRRAGSYYCPKKNVLMRSSETSCLTALYFRRYNVIKKTCPLTSQTMLWGWARLNLWCLA